MRSRASSARAIASEALRSAADSLLGPRQHGVRIVERPTIPPAIDWWPFSLRRRADPIEGPVTDWIAVIAKKLTDLLPRETSLSGLFN